MSLHRRAAKRDANAPEIVLAFVRAGCSVQAISAAGVPDLLVGYRGANVLVEIKAPGGKLNTLQRSWAAAWRGSKPYVVHDPDDVPALLRDVVRELDIARGGEGL